MAVVFYSSLVSPGKGHSESQGLSRKRNLILALFFCFPSTASLCSAKFSQLAYVIFVLKEA